MVKSQQCEKAAVKKGPWSPDEDHKLIAYIQRYGIWNWSQMPKPAGLARSGKSCRLRWVNYLRPDIKRGSFSKEEEEAILKLHETMGNRWSAIAATLPGRTDNEIKNYWHTHLKKRFKATEPVQEAQVFNEKKKLFSETELFLLGEAPKASKLETTSTSSSSGTVHGDHNKDQIAEQNICACETFGELQSLWAESHIVRDSEAIFTDPGFTLSNPPTQSWLQEPIFPSGSSKVFKLILSKGSMVNVVSYNTLINGYCKHKMMDEAMMLLREMSRKGLVPDIVTYSTLVDGCCKVGKLGVAQKLFSEMQACGQLPDVRTYAILLDGLCKNRQLSTAIQLFKEMEGKKLDADIVIYNILIEGLCLAGKIESARVLFHWLSSKGLQPNVRTYTIMINGLCIGGLTSEAEKLLTEMEEKGCPPNDCTYNIIIRGFINNNETVRVTGLIQQMVEKGFSADAWTTELIVELLGKDKVDPALLPLMQKENYELNLPQLKLNRSSDHPNKH